MCSSDLPLWPPQRGVGLQEPNLGKTNPRVTLFICLRFVLLPLLRTRFLFLTLTRLVVVINFVNFSFALFTPPLGDFQSCIDSIVDYKSVVDLSLYRGGGLDPLHDWIPG